MHMKTERIYHNIFEKFECRSDTSIYDLNICRGININFEDSFETKYAVLKQIWQIIIFKYIHIPAITVIIPEIGTIQYVI